ncbi:hypothetical protein J5X84_16535 [Streptosporangiaceae bacterium NEAU-GS5]|nr:hypothetical protein [Streptosporangiaceae bacterium NEAU-GS5]
MKRWFVALALGLMAGALCAAGPATAAPAGSQVALIGVPGLMWSDLSPSETPNLWRLAGQSAIGSLSVRTVGSSTCPYDGWLTVSTGVRTAVGSRCGEPPEPVNGTIPEYSWLSEVAGVAGAGTLGQALKDAGKRTLAVGAGAALGVADASGHVDVYAGAPGQVSDWTAGDVVAVEVPDLVLPYFDDGKLTRETEKLSPDARRQAVRQADMAVGTVLNGLPTTTTVLLAGLGDHGWAPHLRVAMLRAPGAAGHALGSRSTHRDDMTILPDLTATILAEAGVPAPATVVGVEMAATGARPTADGLRAADVAGQTIRDMTALFFTALAVLQVLFYIVAFLLLRRRRGLSAVRTAALALASIPVATYLANLTPWAFAAHPTLALVAAIVAIAAALTALALATGRRGVLLPLTVVAGLTAAVLLIDLLTGTNLQLNSVMGYTGVVGARYYGLGNIPFALLATAVLLVTAAGADRLLRAGRKAWAVALVASLGGFAMILDGWPGVGSDFGGVIAFVPGIAVAALLVAGKRVSVVKLGAFCVAGGVVVMGIAFLDHLRPPDRQTHLGRFVGQVLDGTFWPVIGRKLGAMLHTLLSPNLMPVVIAAFAFLIFALLRPDAASAGVLPVAFERAPALRAGLLGALVSGVVGMLVNDSGAAVLSMALALAVPLVLSAGIGVLRLGEPSPGPLPEPSTPPSRVT